MKRIVLTFALAFASMAMFAQADYSRYDRDFDGYRNYDRGRSPVIAANGRVIIDDGMIIFGPSSKDIKRINKKIEKRNKQIYKEQRKREKEWEKRTKKIRKEQRKYRKRYDRIFGKKVYWDDDDWVDDWDDDDWDD